MKLRFFAAARRELLESALYLEEQELGLGERFMDDVERALALIRTHPQAWNPIGPGLRRCRLVVFRYGLIYRIRETAIEIVAVAPDSRRPGYWRTRIKRGR